MPRPPTRPTNSGYARLTQADEEDGAAGYDDEYDVDDQDPYNPRSVRTLSASGAPTYEPIQPGQQRDGMSVPSGPTSPASLRRGGRPMRRRPRRSSSGVDIKAINMRLERWADEIASRFKIHKVKGKSHEEEHLEIHHTVFQPPPGVRPVTSDMLHSEAWPAARGERISKMQFDDIVESVRTAIELGVHPLMISQGSSGSYFARNAEGKVVGVFKPKDEEPYASRNPKWTKWIHRNLFPCFFGRACLIPNLSYVSEAAAYTLDSRLCTNIVPYTDVVHLSSKSFYYDIWQRSAFYRKRKPLPEKPGSFQVFLNGFKDATKFLSEHPWPDEARMRLRTQDVPRKRSWRKNCAPGEYSDDEDERGPESEPMASSAHSPQSDRFQWTDEIQQSFREELEKLVILDYIMRNTDRGLDNWMIKVDQNTQKVTIVSEPMQMNGFAIGDNENDEDSLEAPHPVPERGGRSPDPYRLQAAMNSTSRSGTPAGGKRANTPNISIGAIDNSLSWPWKHPDAWRSFPFGWLFLPVSLIGQPFSAQTREHFLPLLTSSDWWSGTQIALRHVFEQDSDFKESMFARQMAVMKGQAWNVVETLKIHDHGPLELTRRTRVCVWDDVVDIPVAVPLRTPPPPMRAEFRRQRDAGASASPGADRPSAEIDEMDISAAAAITSRSNGLSKQRDDLLRFSPPQSIDLPNPNRFSLSRNPSATGAADLGVSEGLDGSGARDFATDISGTASGRPGMPRSKTRPSFELGSAATAGASHARHRASSSGRFSFSSRHGLTMFLDDQDEGDLGYAAARVTEKNTRKVIVERLETVKSRHPFFTWC